MGAIHPHQITASSNLLQTLEIHLRRAIGRQNCRICGDGLESDNAAVIQCSHVFCTSCLRDLEKPSEFLCPLVGRNLILYYILVLTIGEAGMMGECIERIWERGERRGGMLSGET
jgi:hypothetical protein